MVFYDVISERTVTSVLNNYKLSRSNSHIDSCIIGSDGDGYSNGSDLFIACASMGKWTGIFVTHAYGKRSRSRTIES